MWKIDSLTIALLIKRFLCSHLLNCLYFTQHIISALFTKEHTHNPIKPICRYQESVANGEIGIFALNGEAYIKKLKDDKDGIFLISLNEKYAPIKVGENGRLDIFGKVLGKSDASALTDHCR